MLKYIRIGVMIIKRPETVKSGCWGSYHNNISIRHFGGTLLCIHYTDISIIIGLLSSLINYQLQIYLYIVVIDGNGTSVRCLEGRKDWYTKVEPFQSIFPICSHSLPTTNQTTTFCIIHNTLFTIATPWNDRRNWFLKHFIVTLCLHLVELPLENNVF